MDASLSNPEFYILLSLALKSRHGYEVMQQVESDSAGKVRLGPGTLYGAIKRMLNAELIGEIPGDNPRRKYYAITEKGRTALSSELERYQSVLDLAIRKRLLGGSGFSNSTYI